MIALGLDAGHHAGYGVVVVGKAFLLAVGGDIAAVGAVGDGNLASLVAVGITHPADEGAAVFAVEYQVVASDMAAVDGTAHHEGGQCAAIVDGAAEDGIYDRQITDVTVGVAEECWLVGGLLEVDARAARRDVALYIEDELAVFECERLIVVDALCKRDEGAYVTDGVRVRR